MAKANTAPYKVIFNWAKDDANKDKLTAVSCEEENIPADKTVAGQLINAYLQVSTGEVQEAALTVNKFNTLYLKKGGFLYMDVGCWLGGKQTFGLVCGGDAMVCEYDPGHAAGAGKNSGNVLLDEFTRLPGVSVQFWEKILSPRPADPNRLYVILPDMHVAEAPPPGHARPPDDPKWGKTDFGGWGVDPQTYDEMSKRDMFDSRASMAAMISFLSMVRGAGRAGQITLVQIGDMYELWAARELFFKRSEDAQVHIIGKGVTEVGEWVGRTHLLYPYLFHAFDECEAKGMQMLFLHGNHDDYLSVPAVIVAANTYIQTEPTRYGGDTREGPVTTVHRRHKEIAQDGIFFEHGQRCDQYNRDGETAGYEKANSAADPGFLMKIPIFFGADPRKVESTRRPSFVVGAAAEWCVRQGDFGLYVMGHTHKADLHRVEVYHKLEERIYSPEGVIVIDGGPLDGVSR